MKRAFVFAALLTILAGRDADAADPVPIRCAEAPAAHAGIGTNLPNTASAMRRGDELVIVAIGSSSTSGVGASHRTRTYPARLETELRRLWPNQALRVVNKGVGGETAQQMVARFERDVLSHDPDLVIWQMGTNLMLRHGSPEALTAVLRAGVRALKSAQIDVVLMDPQFAPKVLAVPSHPQFVGTIAAVARDENTGLFNRFAVMRGWVQAGAFSVDEIVSPDKLHMNDVSYTCVARALAGAIAGALRSAPMPMAVRGADKPAR